MFHREAATGRVLSRHAPQLDSLRALAVALVIGQHFAPADATHGLPLGYLGVRAFFVLSGFLITGILLRCRTVIESDRGLARTVILHFYGRRFLRLMPLFYLTLVVAWAAGVPEVRDTLAWHLTYATNIYFALTGEWHGTVSHLWSLAVEEQFYLAWPFVIIFTPRRHLLATLIGVAAIGPVFRMAGTLAGVDWLPLYTLPFGAIDSLAIGGLLAYASDPAYCSGNAVRRSITGAGLFVGAPLLVFSCALAATRSLPALDFPRATLDDTIWAFFFAWVIDRCARGFSGMPKHVLEWKPLVYVGTISYGLYLLHPFVPGLMRWCTERIGVEYPAGAVNEFAWLVSATIVLASASWYLYERPLNGLKRHLSYDVPQRPSSSLHATVPDLISC